MKAKGPSVCVCVEDANDTSSDWFYADTDGLVNVNSPRNLHGQAPRCVPRSHPRPHGPPRCCGAAHAHTPKTKLIRV